MAGKLENREDKRPFLSDLPESDVVEQIAETIMLLYREDIYNAKTTEQSTTEVSIAKQRSALIGKIELLFSKINTRFSKPNSLIAESNITPETVLMDDEHTKSVNEFEGP